MSEDADDGVSLQSPAPGPEGARLSWPEVWSVIGIGADESISTTQADLIAECYPLRQSVDAAVADDVLVEVQDQGATVGGESQLIRAGYRLVGGPVEPEGGDWQ